MKAQETVLKFIESIQPVDSVESWEVVSRHLNKLLGDLENGEGNKLFPVSFMRKTLLATISGEWSDVGKSFIAQEFVHPTSKYFFLLGPYSVLRKGKQETKITAIFGRVLDHRSMNYLADVAEELFAKQTEIINLLLPVEVHAGVGFIAKECGEAFIVPDGWQFPNSKNGPALNDMVEQRRRVDSAGRQCIEAVFDESSAALLLGSIDSAEPWYSIQHKEFSYHEVGHATGLGLKSKLSGGCLNTPWYRGVEEWRSDGIGFELMTRTLSRFEAGKIIAANLVLRFGVDAQRRGGLERDTDVSASLLTFERMMESGCLKIGKDRKLAISNSSCEGLVSATEQHRFDAVQLTNEENELTYIEGLWGLYGSVKVGRSARNLFNGLVTAPCSGIYQNLN